MFLLISNFLVQYSYFFLQIGDHLFIRVFAFFSVDGQRLNLLAEDLIGSNQIILLNL